MKPYEPKQLVAVSRYLNAFGLTPWIALHLFYIMILMLFSWMNANGFAAEALAEAAALARTLPHVRVRGVMTIPPADATREENMVYLRKVQALYVDINEKLYDNKLEYISMGMSGDFEDAIRAGSNMVRVGTAIFGQRYYAK